MSTLDVSSELGGGLRERWESDRAKKKKRRPSPPPLPSVDSRLLVTGSSDSSAKLWDVKTGTCLYTWQYDAPCKAVAFSLGDSMVATSTDPFMSTQPAIRIYKLNTEDPTNQTDEPFVTLTGFSGRINRLLFHDLNHHLLSVGEDGFIRRWDVETGKLLDEVKVHDAPITDLQASVDGTQLVTSSLDTTAHLLDAVDFTTLKTYKSGTNCNGAAISPLFNHVLIGGGQDAAQVTTTSARAGNFEARVFSLVHENELGKIRGAFGPLNTVAFAPDGRVMATGGEDGYVRVYNLFESQDYMRQGAKDRFD